MPNTIDLYDTYHQIAVIGYTPPVPSWIRDRYFPSSDMDIFKSGEVLIDYMKGRHRIAPYMADDAGDMLMGRDGYSTHTIEPATIMPSRVLTVDELTKRGFGESLLAGSDPVKRAALLMQKDLRELDDAISGTEEWACATLMLNNEVVIQTMIDSQIKGPKKYLKYFEGHSHHKAVLEHMWTDPQSNPMGDVAKIADTLTADGLPATDLLIGSKAYDLLYNDKEFRELLKKDSGIEIGSIREELTKYPGVVYAGTVNFHGHYLNIFKVIQTYMDPVTGKNTNYFPANTICITAPACGHLLYGGVIQIDYGSTTFSQYNGKRIPKLHVDSEHNIRKQILTSRPVPAPKNDTPWRVATVCE